MKKILKYLTFIPFAICLGSLIIYLAYTIKIKFNSSIIVTDDTVNALKTYLTIALVSLFIGLAIILVKKVYYLLKDDKTTENERNIKEFTIEEKDDSLKSILKDPEEIMINDKKKYKLKLNAVSCPQCDGLISKEAAICPHCGILFDEEILKFINKYNKQLKKEQKIIVKEKKKPMVLIANILLIILFIILTFLVINLLINKAHENHNNVTPVQIIEKN